MSETNESAENFLLFGTKQGLRKKKDGGTTAHDPTGEDPHWLTTLETSACHPSTCFALLHSTHTDGHDTTRMGKSSRSGPKKEKTTPVRLEMRRGWAQSPAPRVLRPARVLLLSPWARAWHLRSPAAGRPGRTTSASKGTSCQTDRQTDVTKSSSGPVAFGSGWLRLRARRRRRRPPSSPEPWL